MRAGKDEIRAEMHQMSPPQRLEHAGQSVGQGAVHEQGVLGMVLGIVHLRPGHGVEHRVRVRLGQAFLKKGHLQQIAVGAAQGFHLPAAFREHACERLTQKTGSASQNQGLSHLNLPGFSRPRGLTARRNGRSNHVAGTVALLGEPGQYLRVSGGRRCCGTSRLA